jgi:hypothetical protein
MGVVREAEINASTPSNRGFGGEIWQSSQSMYTQGMPM